MTKTYNYMVVFLLLSVSGLFAGWRLQSSGTTKSLNSVKFVDQDRGVAVGSTGLILGTNDGGTTWASIESGTKKNLNEVFFINSSTGWICGDEGTLLKTTNGGKSWLTQDGGTSLNLESIYFYDVNRGWAVGDAQRIISTENSGAAWQIETYSPYDASVVFRSIHAPGPASAWIVGDAAFIVRKSTEWVYSGINSISEFTRFNKIFFLDQNYGWIVGRKASLVFSKMEILKTVNGGSSWQFTYPDPDGTMGLEALNDVIFLTRNLGWAVGQDGKIIKTKDGGGTWSLQDSLTTKTFNSVSFVDENNGWIVGKGGMILHTSNGGEKETRVSREPSHSLNSFTLEQNYPNPFNSQTNIEFTIKEQANVNLAVFNISGQQVSTLVSDILSPGSYKFTFDAKKLPGSVYLYKLTVDQQTKVSRMLYLP